MVYRYDPTRPEAAAARVDRRHPPAGRRPQGLGDPRTPCHGAGSRYIDFLIPGLIGLNTMGGGLWGVGFLLVNFRIGKLLK